MKEKMDLRHMPPEMVGVVLRWLEGWKNDSADLRAPLIRSSIVSLYPGLVVMYSLVLVGAAVLNCGLIYTLLRSRLYNHGLLLSLAVSNLLLSCFVLPPTVAVLILHNWPFGRFLCHLLPLVQDMFIHATVLTHLMIIVDRYRLVQRLPQMPASVTSLGVWLLSLCLVLPYQPYITYLDLVKYLGPQFQGVGICTASITGYLKQYTRVLVQVVYLLPVCVMCYLYLRMRIELQRREECWDVVYEPKTSFDSTSRLKIISHRVNKDIGQQEERQQETQLPNEKLFQQCIGIMAAICTVCLCPLMVLRLAKTSVLENQENSGHLEILYSLFVWFVFLPTVTSPLTSLYWYLESTGRINVQQRLSRSNWFNPQDTTEIIGSQRSGETPARGLLSSSGNILVHDIYRQ